MPAGLTFDSLPLDPALLKSLAELGYARMTPVQATTLPAILAGRDVAARASTGTGKTAAFALGVLQRLDLSSARVQALVLCPTRELAEQVAREIRRLARSTPNVKVLGLGGGVSIGPQIASLEHSAHVIVGTPGRVLKHLRKGSLHLQGLGTLVLDEADRMLDMGFSEEIDELLTHVPAARQTLLFSATYPEGIAAISARVQRDPVHVDVTGDAPPPRIDQYRIDVIRETRDLQLARALARFGGERNLVFCNTRVDCETVAASLVSRGIAAVSLHGDLEQRERTGTLVRFANGSATVLIATDVAARGLDVEDVDAVFNYELPTQSEVYVHRIGRTARAGKAGVAVSLLAPREHSRLAAIERIASEGGIETFELPEDLPPNLRLEAAMVTLEINGGRRNKLRPGDLLGALTGEDGIPGSAVGKIDLFEQNGYVAVQAAHAEQALARLNARGIKGRPFRARLAGRRGDAAHR